MKNSLMVGVLFGFVLLCLSANASLVSAQARRVECGDSIMVQVARDGETHEYTVNMQANSRLFVNVETLAAGIEVDAAITAPDGLEIDALSSYYSYRLYQTATDILYQPGSYAVYVRGFTATGGAYRLNIGCVDVTTGAVTSSSKFVQGIVCGSIVEGEFSLNQEIDRYYIYLEENTELRVSAQVESQNLATLKLDLGITTPSGYDINTFNTYYSETLTEAQTPVLTESGTYRIPVGASTTIGGNYVLYVGCTLPDGTVISPGDAPSNSAPTSAPTEELVSLPEGQLTNFGYPGLTAIDFSSTILTPISSQLYGVPITSSIPVAGSGVSGFSIEAVEGDVLDISAQRSSGNLPIGIVVFAEPNIPVFIAGPISSSTFSTEITLPQNGNYVIGLFRMGELPVDGQDTDFQIRIGLNP